MKIIMQKMYEKSHPIQFNTYFTLFNVKQVNRKNSKNNFLIVQYVFNSVVGFTFADLTNKSTSCCFRKAANKGNPNLGLRLGSSVKCCG